VAVGPLTTSRTFATLLIVGQEVRLRPGLVLVPRAATRRLTQQSF
jgi:hypothetical protein